MGLDGIWPVTARGEDELTRVSAGNSTRWVGFVVLINLNVKIIVISFLKSHPKHDNSCLQCETKHCRESLYIYIELMINNAATIKQLEQVCFSICLICCNARSNEDRTYERRCKKHVLAILCLVHHQLIVKHALSR